MKKEINVCDVCNARIATYRCFLCEKDLCNNCRRTGVQDAIYTCEGCHRRVCEHVVKIWSDEELRKCYKTVCKSVITAEAL